MKAQIQGVQDAAGTRHYPEGFQVAGMIPHEGSHALAAAQSKLLKSSCQPPRALVELSIRGAHHGAVRFARNNFDARKKLSSALQHSRQGQRKTHHGAKCWHGLSPESRTRILSLFQA